MKNYARRLRLVAFAGTFSLLLSMSMSHVHAADSSVHDRQLSLVPSYDTTEETSGSKAAVENDAAALSNKLSNPISDLISIPFQFNYDEPYGPKKAGRTTLNIQPVIPFTLNDDWNLIVRTILPVINQESAAKGESSEFGVGDITQSFFFSPKGGDWVWGVGPVFLWPVASDDGLGAEKFGAGPTAVVLKQEHGWTYGALVNHIWSYAGDGDRGEVNATFLQPFLSYTWPSATSLTFNTESTYDWSEDQWTVPINLMLGQVVKLGKLPVSLQLGGRYYAESPDGGPDWGARFNFVILLPK